MGTGIQWRSAVACLIPLLLAVIGGPVCYVLLVVYTFGITFYAIRRPQFPHQWLLFCTALSFLWSTTLLSATVVGTDIHAEYRLAWTAWQYGWDYTNIHIYNSSLLAVPFTAAISKLFRFDPVWSFKLAIPALAAVCAPVLFRMYRQYVSTAIAYIATLLVVLTPTFLVELLGMARQMVALPFMLLTLALLVDRNQWAWRSRKHMAVMLACGLLTATAHYTTGMMLFFLMGFTIAFLVAAKLLRHNDVPPLRGPIITFLLIVALAGVYYLSVGQGIVAYTIAAKIGPFLRIETSLVENMKPPGLEPVVPPIVPGESANPNTPATAESLLENHERAMQLALGNGAKDHDPLVRIWWVLQYIMQGAVIAGAGYALWRWLRYRQWNSQYMGLASGAMMLGLLCVVLPAFSALLNATRFWLIVLMFLAPMVVSVLVRAVKSTTVAFVLLIPYLLFTTGIVFEIAQYDVSVMRIPYSIALSNDRVDLGASFTTDDIAARQYIIDNQLYPIYTDWYGAMFLCEKVPDEQVYWGWPQRPTEIVSSITPDDYVFLRSRNMDNNEWIDWNGIGTRAATPLDSKDFMQRDAVYQSGSAKILTETP